MAGKRREKGTGSVYPRKNAKGEITGWGVALGDSYQKVLTEAEGKALLVKWQHEANQGIVRSKPVNRTVSDLLAEWLKESVTPSRRPHTINTAERIIRLHIDPELGSINLSALDTLRIRRFLNMLAADPPKGKGLRYGSIQTIRATLHSALNAAIEWDWLPEGRNPCSKARVPLNARKAKEKPKFTPGQAAQLIAAFEGSACQHPLTAELGTGMRPGEILGMTRANLTFNPATGRPIAYRLESQLQWFKFGPDTPRRPLLVKPKTDGSVRDMDIGTVAGEAIYQAIEHANRTWAVQLQAGTLGPNAKWAMEAGLVFVNSNGAPIRNAYLFIALQRCLRRAGMEHISPHKLRALWATRQVSRGDASILEIATAGGWSDPKTMFASYTQKTQDGQKRVAAASDAMFNEEGV